MRKTNPVSRRFEHKNYIFCTLYYIAADKLNPLGPFQLTAHKIMNNDTQFTLFITNYKFPENSAHWTVKQYGIH